MKLLFAIPSMAAGGAQRVLANLAHALFDSGDEVIIVTFDGTNADFFELPAQVKRIRLGANATTKSIFGALLNNGRQIKQMARVLRQERPDVCVSFLSRMNVISVLACKRAGGTPCVITEHAAANLETHPVWRTLIRFSYSCAQKLVSVSQGVDKDFSWLPDRQRAVIENLIETNSNLAEFRPEARHFLTMGRLSAEKNHLLLLDAFFEVQLTHPDVMLTILGDGPMRTLLEETVSARGMTGKVLLPGAAAQPFDRLKEADIFVLSSDSEGFGNVIVEAMATGLPVISTDCPHGPAEVVVPGTGVLVPMRDTAALSDAMRELLADSSRRMQLRTAGLQRSKVFGREAILPQWRALFAQISAG